MRSTAPAHALGDGLAERARAVRQDDRELLAADARDEVHRPHGVEQGPGDRTDHLVAGAVAVAVVDALEVVDVEREQQRRLAAAGDAVDLARERQLEAAAVGDAGQRVAARQVDEGIDEPLHPARAAGVARRRGVPRLRQQLQRLVQAQLGLRACGAVHESRASLAALAPQERPELACRHRPVRGIAAAGGARHSAA